MMKKRFFLLAVLMSAMTGMAQDADKDDIQAQAEVKQAAPVPYIGFLSCDSLLKVMPQYAIVQKQMSDLRQAYETELKRVEDEFNQKYEAFLDGQKDFPRTILLKRQNELQELLKKNVEFKQQGRSDLRRAEQEAMAPLRQRLQEAIARVAHRQGLALVVNTDSEACPYIAPENSVDIQDQVAALLLK